MALKETPLRKDVDSSLKWRLEDLVESKEAWSAGLALALEEAAGFQEKTAGSAQELLALLQRSDALHEKTDRLYVYAHLKRDEDTADPEGQSMAGQADAMITKVMGATAFLAPMIVGLGRKRLDGLMEEEPGLGIYRSFFDSLLRLEPHVLAPEMERALALAREIGGAGEDVFSMLNDADLVFEAAEDSEGRKVEVTHGKYGGLMESSDRKLRQSAFESCHKAYLSHKNTLAACLASGVKADIFFSRMRKYGSCLEAALDEDAIGVEVYSSLIEAVRESLPSFHRHMRLKRKALKLDELHMYDMGAPIIPDVDAGVDFAKAKGIVLEALKPLGEDYREAAAAGMSGGWIDALESKGKRSGAYAWGAYGSHPYVLLNYDGKIDDMFTLAHEMGHAMHSWHSWGSQPYVYGDYPVFLAEVASTVNEALLMDHLLKTEKDARKRAWLVNSFLEQFRTIVFRQTMFAEFEMRAHEMAEAGAALTEESMSALYRGLCRDYHGDGVVLDSLIDMEWARIPHFYSSFYVYKYATGYSAAIALSKRIIEGGPEAAEAYKGFLRSGSSRYPLDTLKKAGVDMSSPEPVREALKLYSGLIAEMEGLAAGLGG